MPRKFTPKPKCCYIVRDAENNTDRQCRNGSIDEIEDKLYCKVHADLIVKGKWLELDKLDLFHYETYSTIRKENIYRFIDHIKQL